MSMTLKSALALDELQRFVQRRHVVGAALARDDDGARRIAHPRGFGPVPALQMPVNEAAGERIACPQDVQHGNLQRFRVVDAAISGVNGGTFFAALEDDPSIVDFCFRLS
jgi:hypothetical protein